MMYNVLDDKKNRNACFEVCLVDKNLSVVFLAFWAVFKLRIGELTRQNTLSSTQE